MWCLGHVPYVKLSAQYKSSRFSVIDSPKSTCRDTTVAIFSFVACADNLQKWHLHESDYTIYTSYLRIARPMLRVASFNQIQPRGGLFIFYNTGANLLLWRLKLMVNEISWSLIFARSPTLRRRGSCYEFK